uniref:Uncharacterized protein n=1 Tax=viral metagenome TaxID=1070528 RepID=A0A6M3LSY3_9ZZZZ
MNKEFENVIATEVKIYPGGIEVRITTSDEAGFTSYLGWIDIKDIKEDKVP